MNGKKLHRVLEYTNHLSNVLTVISDKKLYNSTSERYSSQVVSTSDYYPFGLSMYGKQYDSGRYRFGFNGKENDTEYGSSQLVQDYGFRIYNPSIGRFLSEDPLTKQYPELTPYQFASNTPIQAIDLDGLEAINYNIPRADYADGGFANPLNYILFNVNSAIALGNGAIGAVNYSVDLGTETANNGLYAGGEKLVTDAVIDPATKAYTYAVTTPISQIATDAYNFSTDVQTYENIGAALIAKRIAFPKVIKSTNKGSSSLQIAIKQTSFGDYSHVKLGIQGQWYGFVQSNTTGKGLWTTERSPKSDYKVYETKITPTEANNLVEAVETSEPSKFSYACNNCSTNATKMLNKNTSVRTTHGGLLPTVVVNPKKLEKLIKVSNGFEEITGRSLINGGSNGGTQ